MEASALRAPLAPTRIPGTARLLRLRSDEQLVAQFRDGSEEAFSVLHDRYRQRLFAYVRQMLPAGTRSDAEDVLQDVFVRAYFALRADDRPMAARAWLYRVAHNRCIDALRRPAPLPIELPEVAASDLYEPMAQASRREDLARLVTDLGRLPEQQRSALLMRELEGLSYADLAAALDCTLPAVKSLLVRARMGLAEAACARDTACADIRTDLATTCDSGSRSSATARRHMRDCDGCRQYRDALRSTARSFGAMTPSHGPLAALLKLLGLGGSGAAGGGLLGGGSAAGVAVGGGTAAVTATKVAVVVCCVAGVAGGARQIEQQIRPAAPAATATTAKETRAAVARAARAAAASPVALTRVDPQLRRALAAPAPPKQHLTTPIAAVPAAAYIEPALAEPADISGGVLAPDEPVTELAPADVGTNDAAGDGHPVGNADNDQGKDKPMTEQTVSAAPVAEKPLALEPASEPAPSTDPAVTGGATPPVP